MLQLNMASDIDYLYAVIMDMDRYISMEDTKLNPLSRYVIQQFKQRGVPLTTENQNPVLVRLKFDI